MSSQDYHAYKTQKLRYDMFFALSFVATLIQRTNNCKFAKTQEMGHKKQEMMFYKCGYKSSIRQLYSK